MALGSISSKAFKRTARSVNLRTSVTSAADMEGKSESFALFNLTSMYLPEESKRLRISLSISLAATQKGDSRKPLGVLTFRRGSLRRSKAVWWHASLHARNKGVAWYSDRLSSLSPFICSRRGRTCFCCFAVVFCFFFNKKRNELNWNKILLKGNQNCFCQERRGEERKGKEKLIPKSCFSKPHYEERSKGHFLCFSS